MTGTILTVLIYITKCNQHSLTASPEVQNVANNIQSYITPPSLQKVIDIDSLTQTMDIMQNKTTLKLQSKQMQCEMCSQL